MIVDDKKRTVGLYLPKVNVGIEFRMANALDGSLPQLQNIRKKFEGELYVYTGDGLYAVHDEFEELTLSDFWKSLS